MGQLIPKHGSSTATVRLEQTRSTNNIFFAISPSTFVIASKPDRDKLMCIFFSSLRYGPEVLIPEPMKEKNSRHALRRLIIKPFFISDRNRPLVLHWWVCLQQREGQLVSAQAQAVLAQGVRRTHVPTHRVLEVRMHFQILTNRTHNSPIFDEYQTQSTCQLETHI